MAQSHVTSGIANKINLLNKHKQALLKQIQDIDQQISILTQAAHIMGESEQLPRLRSSVFNQSIKTLVVQVLKQATQPLSSNEITEQAAALDNPTQSSQEPIEITAKHLKSTRNALNLLISEGVVSKSSAPIGFCSSTDVSSSVCAVLSKGLASITTPLACLAPTSCLPTNPSY